MENRSKRTSKGDAATQLILTVFRANGALLAAGDALVAPLGLTSARWQVLGAIALAGRGRTAPQIADAMGLTRQAVQKQLNHLTADGLVQRRANPAHQKSDDYHLAPKGERVYTRARGLQRHWVNRLAQAIPIDEIESAARLLEEMASELRNSATNSNGETQ